MPSQIQNLNKLYAHRKTPTSLTATAATDLVKQYVGAQKKPVVKAQLSGQTQEGPKRSAQQQLIYYDSATQLPPSN